MHREFESNNTVFISLLLDALETLSTKVFYVFKKPSQYILNDIYLLVLCYMNKISIFSMPSQLLNSLEH